MKLGEKLRQSRLEMGLSQRQLCEGVITRNMLSQIEHGTAKPSMETLRQLAARLEKPVSFFLEEDWVMSPNQERMVQARQYLRNGDFEKARQMLLSFRQNDEVYRWEREYLLGISTLAVAEQALREEKQPLARQLLEELEPEIPELERRRLLLQGKLPGADVQKITRQLPSVDEELLLRAKAALAEEDWERAEALLMAAEDQDNPLWNLLRGKTLMLAKRYDLAAECLEKAQQDSPKECWRLLETCFRELGDFRMAYEYRCKQG